MIDHAQKDANIKIAMTIFTVRVARAKSAQNEKSISCAKASVSASICLLSRSAICLADLRLLTGASLDQNPTKTKNYGPETQKITSFQLI